MMMQRYLIVAVAAAALVAGCERTQENKPAEPPKSSMTTPSTPTPAPAPSNTPASPGGASSTPGSPPPGTSGAASPPSPPPEPKK